MKTSSAMIALLVLGAAAPASAYPTLLGNFYNIDTASGISWPAAVVYTGERHLFDTQYNPSSGTSTVRWCRTTGSSCSWTVIDGAGGLGHIAGLHILSPISAVVWGVGYRGTPDGILHVFYTQFDLTPGALRSYLRHLSYNGSFWRYETLDGNGGPNGRTTHDVGGGTIGVAGFSHVLFVSYYDSSARKLRLARLSPPDKWGTTVWSFQELDGAGGDNGRINAQLGGQSTLVATNTHIHVFYSDETNQDLRHAWWHGTYGDWSFNTFDDGGTGSAAHRVDSEVGAAYHSGVLHVFYTDLTSRDIIHGSDAGGGWNRNPHATAAIWGGSLGIYTNNSVCSDGFNVHVFFADTSHGNLMHSFGRAGPGDPWAVYVADGDTSADGKVDGVVGKDSACVPEIPGGRLGALYTNAGAPGMRLGLTTFDQ